MSQDRIKELLSQIKSLEEEVKQLQTEEAQSNLGMEWICPGICIKYDFVPNVITGYMKIQKVETIDKGAINVYGKRIIISHKDFTTQVSFNPSDSWSIINIMKHRVKEIGEDVWNEKLKKAKDFVVSFE